MFNIVIELLVAALLILTIVYCIIVNRKLDKLRAHQESLKSIIQDLNQSTLHAETATGELKKTVHKASTDLNLQIDKAERISQSLRRQNDNADLVVNKLEAITLQNQKEANSSIRKVVSDFVRDEGNTHQEFSSGLNMNAPDLHFDEPFEPVRQEHNRHHENSWERTKLTELSNQDVSTQTDSSSKRSRFQWES